MKTLAKYFFILVILLSAACASTSGKLIKANTSARVFDMEFDTSLDWAKDRFGRYELWTVDGPYLNSLWTISKIRPKEHVFLTSRERKSRPDGAFYRTGLRPDELKDLIADAFRGQGYANVETSGLRPASIAGASGIRFEIKQTNAIGLNYAGTVLAIEKDDKLTLIFWEAPVEHYYGRDIEAVNKLMDSVRFVK